jgi:glyoxylase-like metal-dependent hydrolase (beta-lactamase superfamily II)
MQIKIFPSGIYGAITYLIYDEISKEGAIIDCTCSIDEIAQVVKKQNINLKYILITHGHFDHVYCLPEAKETFPLAQILIHKEDMILLDKIETQCQMAEIEEIQVPCVDGLLGDKTHNLNLGKMKLKLFIQKDTLKVEFAI